MIQNKKIEYIIKKDLKADLIKWIRLASIKKIDILNNKDLFIKNIVNLYFNNKIDLLNKLQVNLYIAENKEDLKKYYYYYLLDLFDPLYKKYYTIEGLKNPTVNNYKIPYKKIFTIIFYILLIPILFIYFFILEISKNK